MDERTFNSLMPRVNEEWSAKVLNMKLNPEKGPDLIDNEKAVEVKFKITYSDGRYIHKCWRVLGHQFDYSKKHNEIYWGLGFYNFNRNINELNKRDLNLLERFVDYRELYIVNWDWMKQFPLYHHNGKTDISEWDYKMFFPKFSKMPSVISSKEVYGGKLYFTEGVNPERFNFASNPARLNDECPF